MLRPPLRRLLAQPAALMTNCFNHTPMIDPASSLNYRDSGVDIDAGSALVERIKPAVRRTHRKEVLNDIGGFAGLFALPLENYRQPVLVSATDGVGTKLMLANRLNRHHSVGIDLVAMCVNDTLIAGAEPLFFLDYFASGKLDLAQAEAVIGGVVDGCIEAGCALSGGETAEMPGMYATGEYDLAGFAVGIVEKSRILSADRVRPGDVLLGLASSGAHANGYSLIRRVLECSGADLNAPFGDSTLGETLLTPTRIYVKPILELLRRLPVAALCHITGGGLTDNLPRVLPTGTRAKIDLHSWRWPPVFAWLARTGRIGTDDMLRTFNCGIGMVVCVAEAQVDAATRLLEDNGERVCRLGRVESGSGPARVEFLAAPAAPEPA